MRTHDRFRNPETRAYGGDGSIVFEVRDAVCPWNEGRWKLEGGSAAPTDEPAELALEVDALGSAYLGAVSFAQLAGAARVEELVDGAVARADIRGYGVVVFVVGLRTRYYG